MAPSGCGRFPEGCALDRLDKAISGPIFRLVLPAPVELALSVPGNWFGCPLYAWGVAPILLTATVGRDLPAARLLGLPTLSVGIGVWLRQALVGCQPQAQAQKRGLVQIFRLVHHPAVLFGLSHATMGVITYGGLGSHSWVAALFLSSWYLVQSLCEGIKGMVWRLRPTAALSDLSAVPRKLLEPGYLIRQPDQANLSFPSGDCAGSACFATSLALAAPELRNPAIALAATTALGRMYFHAHHLGDVLAGELCGLGAVLLVHRCAPRPSWAHMGLAQLAMLLSWPLLQRLKPRLPPGSRASGLAPEHEKQSL